ncbi:MAG: GNAT family N-acetyltransferase [Chloroflexi bacterium]|nr:MAG: GNAT family N-acetyltransferase [Chloroflexota bacterium]
MISYRVLTQPQELKPLPALEAAIWGQDMSETVPTHMTIQVVHNGGVVIGAYDETQIVGFAFAMPYRRGETLALWSLMAGVLPQYQGRGIGFGLKLQQRTWALEHGYESIHWTFDPLQRGNANFNMYRLGAVATRYHINYYGEMHDAINAGLPSDRLEADWFLNDETVQRIANGQTPPQPPYPDVWLVKSHKNSRPELCLTEFSAEKIYAIEVPYHLNALKQNAPDKALAWRLAQRDAFIAAFEQELVVCGFQQDTARSWFVLQKTNPT